MCFAGSLAGHDKDEIYYVYAEEDDFYILVNGKNRTIEYPKKKRKKHVRLIKHLPANITGLLAEADVLDDAVIRKALSLYREEQ